jgi:hypothetical protein
VRNWAAKKGALRVASGTGGNFGKTDHNDRTFQGLDRPVYVPGIARLERLSTMGTFTQVAVNDYSLGNFEYLSRSMAWLFCDGVCLRLIEGLDLLKHRQPSAWALPAYDPTTGKKRWRNSMPKRHPPLHVNTDGGKDVSVNQIG